MCTAHVCLTPSGRPSRKSSRPAFRPPGGPIVSASVHREGDKATARLLFARQSSQPRDGCRRIPRCATARRRVAEARCDQQSPSRRHFSVPNCRKSHPCLAAARRQCFRADRQDVVLGAHKDAPDSFAHSRPTNLSRLVLLLDAILDIGRDLELHQHYPRPFAEPVARVYRRRSAWPACCDQACRSCCRADLAYPILAISCRTIEAAKVSTSVLATLLTKT